MHVAQTLQGVARLGFDAVEGVTNIAEGMFRNIAAFPLPLGSEAEGRAPGIAGLVYKSIRQVNRAVRQGVDPALELAKRHLDYEAADSIASLSLISALNGVIGDHLERSDNPLAIKMEMISNATTPGPDLLIMLHGLAMHYSFFDSKGHNHGEAIAATHGFTPVYVHYNSGLHVSINGREFADQLEQLVDEWPVPVRSIRFFGYSMGGLLVRSGLHAAAEKGQRWPGLTRQVVYMATPHHGSALERGGNWFTSAIKVSPYSAPLAALAMVRSAGITDLRYGNVVDEDWQNQDRFEHHDDHRKHTPLTKNIEHFAIAASFVADEDDMLKRPRGDGLISPCSALGDHKDPKRDLGIPENKRLLVTGTGHLELLSHPKVFDRLIEWLAPT